jgi:hypothetical protein
VPFRVTRTGTDRPSSSELAQLRHEFQSRQCVTLREFLDPRVAAWLRGRVANGRWQTVVHDDLDPPSIDLMLDDEVAAGAILTLTNDPPVFDVVREITSCEAIGSYRFRVYRMDPAAGHTDTWHGDDDGNRLLTLSINLGAAPFEGGSLELRRRGTDAILHRAHNTGAGDAILFRIAPDLEHRVEEVRGSVSKYAIAGWFQREPKRDLTRLVGPSGAW